MNSSTAPILLVQCKAYQSVEDISKSLEHLIKTYSPSSFNICISLPYLFIEPFSKKISENQINIGAEIMLDADEGSFTASVVGKMLEDVNAKFVLIGTAQDRTSHALSGHHLKNKVKAALDAKIAPFICIGETLQEHQEQKGKEILTAQLKDCLEGFSSEELIGVHVVYNADWISRTPWEASSPELQEAYKVFKEVINESFVPGTLNQNQLIVAVPAYSEDLSFLIKGLQEEPNFSTGYSIGILGLSSEFLKPMFA